jgi:hypothetical protein
VAAVVLPSWGDAGADCAAAALPVPGPAGMVPLQLLGPAAARSTARVESSRCAWMQVRPSSSAIALMPGTCDVEQ